MSEYKCEVCDKPLEYSGRGRPPTKCEEHKSVKSNGKSETRPRPRPGAKTDAPKSDAPAPRQRPRPQNELTPPPVGTPDTQSRTKAETASRRSQQQLESVDSETWPRGENGRPMAKITMTASELVPTGQYANVSVGPAQVTAFVDLDRHIDGEGFFTQEERETLTQALNELAEVVERDVIAVQRALVLESMQDQLASAT